MRVLNSSGEWVDAEDDPVRPSRLPELRIRALTVLARHRLRIALLLLAAALFGVGLVAYWYWPNPFTIALEEPHEDMQLPPLTSPLTADPASWEEIREVSLCKYEGPKGNFFMLIGRGKHQNGDVQSAVILKELSAVEVAKIKKDGEVRIKLKNGRSTTVSITESRFVDEREGKP
jgi:hypothetical protein